MCGIAGRSRSLGKSARVCGPGHEAHRRGLGGEIDIGLDDPRDALERPFGAIHAGSAIQFVDIETRCFKRGLVTSLADRGDHSSYVGQPRKPDLGALRREIDRGRSNPRCTANRLLGSRHAGGTGHAFDTEAHRGGMF